jgi:biopolymer transport protein ExbD
LFRRPSNRRRSTAEPVQLNLVPMLDAMVTMISFLLFSMSFLNLVSIETPVPKASTTEIEKQLAERPLQLTLSIRETESQIWSPFDRITSKIIPHAAPGQPDIKAIHEALINVKQQFLTESRLILVPFTSTPYEVLVAIMDNVRVVEPTDPPLFQKNLQTNLEEPVKDLFPEVIFGNLLGDN